MKFIVSLGWIEYEFTGSDDAMRFAITAKCTSKEPRDVTIKLKSDDEEEDDD